jgi:hypothetical protein
MDLKAEMVEGEGRISVDLRANGEGESNEGRVEAEIFRMSSGSAPGAMLQKVAERLRLSATGPGLFEGKFQPDQPGVYLVRAQAGSETASAGLVYQTATEASLGRVNEGVLRELAEIGGGTLLEAGETPALTAVSDPHPREWWPMIVGLLLVLAAGDLLTRRWEQVVGIAESLKMRS